MVTKSFPKSASSFNSNLYVFDDGSTLGGVKVPVILKWTDTVTYGDNIPGWRQALRDGRDATTSLTGNLTRVRIKPGSLVFRVPVSGVGFTQRQEVTGLLQIPVSIPAGNPSSIDTSRADAEALGKFAKKILATKTALQGGVVVGELRQTLSMIRNPARGLRRLVDVWKDAAQEIRAARRLAGVLSSQHRSAVAKNLADAWLEYSFGWRPLLSDIRAGSDALNKYVVGQSLETRRLTSSASTTGNPVETSGQNTDGIARWVYRIVTVDHSQVIYRGALRMEARDPMHMDPALFGFTPSQFLPTAWELLPYSFLIDYFVNIDDVINGWSTLFTELAWCNRTVRNHIRRDYRGWSDDKIALQQHGQSSGVTVVPCEVVIEKASVARAKYTGTYVPDLTFTIPGLGSKKWLNIAALIASRGNDRRWSYD